MVPWPPATGLIAFALLVLGPRSTRAGPHDEFQARAPTHTSSQRYLQPDRRERLLGGEGREPSPSFPKERRRLAASETCQQVFAGGRFGPIRIGYELLEVESVPRPLVNFVEGTLMRRATAYWSSAIQVRQATAPLRAERKGTGCKKYPFDSEWHCAASAPPECGVDGLQIPDRYLKAKRTCSERCSPAYSCSGACWPQQKSCVCNMDDWAAQRSNYCCQVGTPLPADCPRSCNSETAQFVGGGLGGGLVCEGGCSETAEGPGVRNEDLHLFVTIKDTPSCQASSETGAYASWCVKDQCDRPIFGTVNFCLSKLSLLEKDLQLQVSTAVHELAHTMVFSSSLFKYFRNRDGSPMMPRSRSDPDTFANEVWWSCSSGKFNFPDPTGSQRHVDLAPDIVNKFSERGFNDCHCPIGSVRMTEGCIIPFTGMKVPTCSMRIVTPNVRSEARAFFGCDALPGAELENQDSSSCTIIASHWEQRVFNGEVMTAKYGTSGLTYMSRVTLALFKDSGWYRADMSFADNLVPGVHWGYQRGCTFALRKCILNGRALWDRAFCTVTGERSCSLDRTHVRKCSVGDLPQTPPSVFNYFGNNLAGTFDELDYCPTWSIRLTNRQCTSTASIFSPYSNVNMMREVFSPGSRCLESTLRAGISNKDGTFLADPSDYVSKRPACYEVDCAPSGRSYGVSVADVAGPAGATLRVGTCTAEGQVLGGPPFQGVITCAAPAEVCQVVPTIHTELTTAAVASQPAPAPSRESPGPAPRGARDAALSPAPPGAGARPLSSVGPADGAPPQVSGPSFADGARRSRAPSAMALGLVALAGVAAASRAVATAADP